MPLAVKRKQKAESGFRPEALSVITLAQWQELSHCPAPETGRMKKLPLWQNPTVLSFPSVPLPSEVKSYEAKRRNNREIPEGVSGGIRGRDNGQ
jgi:hypothetical protein